MTTLHVIGNVTEDRLYRVPALPCDGETLMATHHAIDIGGKGLNQAVMASRAGLAVRFLAVVGDDPAADRATVLLNAEALEARLWRGEAATDQSIVIVDRHGANIIVSTAGSADALTPDHALPFIDDANAGDVLLVQGNLSQKTTGMVLAAACDRQVHTVLNPSPVRWSYERLWPLVDTVILNRPELTLLSGQTDIAAGLDVLLRRSVSCVLVTLGAQGAVVATASGKHTVPAAPADVRDTTGAGDTFAGAYVAGMSSLRDPVAATRFAASAAAITISRAGTLSSLPSRAELDELVN